MTDRRRRSLPRRTLLRGFRIVHFLGYFCYELVASNVMVTWKIITPRPRLAPIVVAMPLRTRPGLERATYVGMVTLTPGTLALDLRDDSGTLYVHGMHALDVERFRGRLRRLEDLQLAAWRPVDAPPAQKGDR